MSTHRVGVALHCLLALLTAASLDGFLIWIWALNRHDEAKEEAL